MTTRPGTTTDSPTLARSRRRIVSEPLGYVPALDGLRALVLVGVLIFHAGFTWLPGGYLGVSTFFTLSGFLIGSLLLREWNSTSGIGLRPFFRRRFRRLLPASWMTLAVVVIMGGLGVWNTEQLRSLRGDVPFTLAEIVNWHFIAQDRAYGDSFTAPSPLEHFWSLAVEQQFYVVLPILALVVLSTRRVSTQRGRVRLLFGVFIGLSVISAWLNGHFARTSLDRAYFGTDTRMAEMLIGGLLACVLLRRLRMPEGSRIRTLGIAGGLIAMAVIGWLWATVTLDTAWMYPWGFLLTAVCSSAVLFGVLQGGPAAAFLSLGPVVWLGRISYGVYLLHWPVFLWLTPLRTGLAPWPLFALRVGITIAAASVMFHLLEHPIRSGAGLGRVRSAAVLGISAAALLAGTMWVTRDLPPPERITVAPDSSATEELPPPRISAGVVGDQLAVAFVAPSEADGIDIVAAATSTDCGLTVGGHVALGNGTSERDTDRCATTRDDAITTVAATRPDVTLLMPAMRDAAPRRFSSDQTWLRPGDADYDDFLRTELRSVVDRTRESGTEPILMTIPPVQRTTAPEPVAAPPPAGDPAQAGLDTAQRALMGADAPTTFVENDPAAIDTLNRIVTEVGQESGTAVLDLAAHTAAWPGGAFDPTMRAADGVGTTPDGARDVAQWLEQQLRDRVPGPAPGPPPPLVDPNAALPPAPAFGPRRSVAPGAPTKVLVVGDSISYGLGHALAENTAGENLDVKVAAQFGCAVGRGGKYKFQNDLVSFKETCDWAQNFPPIVASFRPDVVVLSSGIWEVVDRRFDGDNTLRHIGSPDVDRFLLGEFLGAIDTLAADGARVVILTQPTMHSGLDKGLTGLPESDPARVQRLNELLAEAVSLRPDVATLVDLRGWLVEQPGGELDPATRPDGIHFADSFAPNIAVWLSPQLVALARG